MQSLYTGVPGVFSGQTHQDDFIGLVDTRLGQSISVSRTPSVVAHVYVPEWSKWERREGNSFCFRAACDAYTQKPTPEDYSALAVMSYCARRILARHAVLFSSGRRRQKARFSCSLMVRAGPKWQRLPRFGY